MIYRKLTHRLRQTGPLLCLVLIGLLTITGAQAQITAVLQRVTTQAVNNPRFQYYPFSYESSGSSIWGPGVPGSQQVDFSLPLNSLPWTEHLGSFFDPCFGVFGGCEFGAGLSAGLTANTSAAFHARADAGSVDLHCPGGVGIIYPEAVDIKPGQPFTVQTYCIVEPTAFMNINAANLSLAIDGRVKAKLDLAIIAEAAGHNLVDINLFKLIGLPSPNIVGEHELFNTGNLARSIKDIPLPIPPNIGSGLFHVPDLGARGTLRSDQLKARAADNFLTFRADLTNLLLQYTAFGIPIPLEGDYDFGGFNLTFHLLDLQLQASAGIRQDFTFDPRPLVQFRIVGGVTRTIRAGESITFTAPPTDGSLRISPTIVYDANRFSDKTSVTVDPALSFNLIKLKGGGHVAGHDLFSFNLNPFGTQTVEFPFDVPLFEQSFALPSPAGFTCPTYVIGASSITAVNDFTAITRVLTEGNGPTTISGSIREAAGSTITLHVQGTKGSKHVTADVNVDGAFTASISEISLVGQYRPLAVSAEYLDLRTNRNVAVNPVTIYWPRPALQAGMFGSIRYNPDAVPYGRLVTYAGTGQFAVTLQSLNVEPDATLLYDDIPIATTIELTENDTQVTGELPGFLLNRGGVHTVSFLNSGLNQQPVLVQSVLVNNAVPTLTDIHNQSDGIGASLMIRGSGFTLDTNVKIGGALRSGALISPSELHVPLLRADRESGVHTVVLSNPAPGGGGVQGSYEVAAIIPDIPVLVARHDLIRSQPAGKHDKNHDKEHDEDDERDNGKDRGEDHDEEHDDDRDKNADTVADLITITNAGKNVLRDVTITSVKLLIKGKVVAESGFPKTLPVLQPGGYCSTQGILPPHSSKAGDAAILQVRGTVHGKAFELSNRVTMPAFDH